MLVALFVPSTLVVRQLPLVVSAALVIDELPLVESATVVVYRLALFMAPAIVIHGLPFFVPPAIVVRRFPLFEPPPVVVHGPLPYFIIGDVRVAVVIPRPSPRREPIGGPVPVGILTWRGERFRRRRRPRGESMRRRATSVELAVVPVVASIPRRVPVGAHAVPAISIAVESSIRPASTL